MKQHRSVMKKFRFPDVQPGPTGKDDHSQDIPRDLKFYLGRRGLFCLCYERTCARKSAQVPQYAPSLSHIKKTFSHAYLLSINENMRRKNETNVINKDAKATDPRWYLTKQ